MSMCRMQQEFSYPKDVFLLRCVSMKKFILDFLCFSASSPQKKETLNQKCCFIDPQNTNWESGGMKNGNTLLFAEPFTQKLTCQVAGFEMKHLISFIDMAIYFSLQSDSRHLHIACNL